MDGDIAFLQIGQIFYRGRLKEIAVLVPEVSRALRDGNLLREISTQGIGAGNDDAIVYAEFEECITNCMQFGHEVFMRNGDLAGLVSTLLGIGHLVLDLDGAGACLDHLLGEEVSGFFVAETGIDVGDDRHNVRLEIIDLRHDLRDVCALGTCFVEFGKEVPQFACIGLFEEGVDLFDQRWNGCFFVHALVGQRAEFRSQGSDHPAGQVDITLVQ